MGQIDWQQADLSGTGQKRPALPRRVCASPASDYSLTKLSFLVRGVLAKNPCFGIMDKADVVVYSLLQFCPCINY